MRVNSNYYAQILTSINATEQRQQTDVEELSTGKRVNTPSDDPTAAAQEVQNVAATADAAQYEQNISSTQSMLQSASSALSSVVTNLTDSISQGVEAANGTMTAAQQTQMASTISGIRDQIISLANTSVQGVYLFGGTASSEPPFKLNSDPTTGVTYSGNSGTNTVPVGSDQTVQTNVPGDQIFSSSSGNVMQSLTDLITALQSNSTSGIETATSEVQSALSTVSLQQEYYGSATDQLTSDNTSLQSETVSLQSQENNLVGANVASVATDLTLTQTSEQAALEAIAKVAPMSLLNYLQ
jgi:flagellar hook-associated protein 3 FlgL